MTNFARMRSCLAKRPYGSETEARAIVKDIRKSGKMARFTGMNAYKCRFCEFWHVGHANRKK
jgi:hypothetical protein